MKTQTRSFIAPALLAALIASLALGCGEGTTPDASGGSRGSGGSASGGSGGGASGGSGGSASGGSGGASGGSGGGPTLVDPPGEAPDGRPAGWRDDSHSKKNVDYDMVFPQDRVNQLHVKCAPEEWAKMQADLKELSGHDPADVPERPSEDSAVGNLDGSGGLGSGGRNPEYSAGQIWPRKPKYIPCDVIFEGRLWTRVGMRYKGQSSLGDSIGKTRKLPLRFKFDAFEDEHAEIKNQRFYGFNHLSAFNQITDASYLRQKLTADLFGAAGVTVPKTAFYRIYIDHGEGPLYFGLYTMTEVPHKPLLNRAFENDDGTLYKCDGSGARFKTFAAASFHRKTNKKSEDYADVQAFITALNAQATPEAWRAGLEATFDMRGFIRFLAINQAMINWDTYGAIAHNYYLYGNPKNNGRLAWIPWDFDLSFDGEGDLALSTFTEDWPLLIRLRNDPVYLAQYRADLTELLAGPFAPERTVAEAARLHALIKPYVTGDEGEQLRYTALGDPADFAAAHEALSQMLRARADDIQSYLQAGE